MVDAINHKSSSFCAAWGNMMKNDTFNCALVTIQVFCFAGESAARKEPSLRCEFIGLLDSSGVRIKASNPHVGSMFDPGPGSARSHVCTAHPIERNSRHLRARRECGTERTTKKFVAKGLDCPAHHLGRA